jgi:tight adherence protein C
MNAVGLAILLGVAMGGGLWLVIAQARTWRAERLPDRVAPRVARISSAAFDHAVERAKARGGYRGLVARTVAAVPLPADRLNLRLRAAGSAASPQEFREAVVARASLGLVVGAAIGGVLAAAGSPWTIIGTLALAGCAVAGWYPAFRLTRAARRAHRAIDAELPIVVGFVAIAVDAGDTVTRALHRVAHTGTGRLCAELSHAMAEIELGRSLDAALSSATERMAHPAVTRVLGALVSTFVSGAPVARALRDEVDALEATRARHLIERASKQEVGMLVPLVFMILPVTILFAVFPGVLALQAGF